MFKRVFDKSVEEGKLYLYHIPQFSGVALRDRVWWNGSHRRTRVFWAA